MDRPRIAVLVALAFMFATPTLASVPDDAMTDARLLQDSARASAVIQAGAAGAMAGRADDELFIGHGYDWGTGLPQDDRAAAQWYRRAAAHGSVKAMVEFGIALENGMGVIADPAQAVGLYRAAADAGSPAAETRLGMALQWGHGVASDACAAAVHYRRAARQGEMMAQLYDLLRLPSGAQVNDCTDRAS